MNLTSKVISGDSSQAPSQSLLSLSLDQIKTEFFRINISGDPTKRRECKKLGGSFQA